MWGSAPPAPRLLSGSGSGRAQTSICRPRALPTARSHLRRLSGGRGAPPAAPWTLGQAVRSLRWVRPLAARSTLLGRDRCSGGWPDRQADGDRGAAAFVGLDFHRAAMQRDEALHDRQAEPDAAPALAAAQAGKAVES